MSFAPGAPQPHSSSTGPTNAVSPQTPGVLQPGPGGLSGLSSPSGPGAPGQPRPGGTRALAGCVPAEPGRRAAAALLDGLVSAAPVVIASIAVQVGLGGELPGLVVVGVVLSVAWLAGVVVVGLRFAQTGVSPGKRVMGLRLVDLRTGGAPGFLAWGRFALVSLGGAVVVGWVVAVVQILTSTTGERRAWYDRVTGLVLLDVEAARDPFFSLPGGPASTTPGPRNGISLGGGSHGGGSFGGGSFDDSPTWVGPPVSSLAPGQHGTQFSQQSAGGAVHLPPVPPPPVAPPVASTPPGAPVVAPAATPAPAAATPAPAAATPAVAPARAIFTFTSGQVHEAAGTGVIGRAPRPSPTRAMPVPDPGVLTVTDVTRTVSKAHLSFRVEASGVWLTDLGSTNGSTIVGRFGISTALVAGTPVLAAYGSTVTVGDLSFTLTSVPAAPDEGDDLEHTIHRDRW